jgi:hypothetical protein
VVYEDDQVVAFMDHKPVNPGHVLVVPRHHAALLDQLDENLSLEVYRVAHRMTRALRRSGLRCEGVNLFLADGEAAFWCRTSICTSFLVTTATHSGSMRTGGFGTVQGSMLLRRGCGPVYRLLSAHNSHQPTEPDATNP